LLIVACPHSFCCYLPLPKPLLPPLPPLTLFWPPSLSLSAIATATPDANVSNAVMVNASAAVSTFTDANLCFCHYPHHRFPMRHSHHGCRLCPSCCHTLVDSCLAHCCHCSANAIANTAKNATTAPVILQSRCRHFVAVALTNATVLQLLILLFSTNASCLLWLVVILPIIMPPLSLLMC
jgi:hypothetical protein